MKLQIHCYARPKLENPVYRVCFNGEIYCFIQRIYTKKCWLWYSVKPVTLATGRTNWIVDSRALGETQQEALLILKHEIVFKKIN